ncbi:MAG: DUF1674 domain-containing protein [Proteobacteria bacterium]|nr:DUF1674 domain-containing protein [Pseudomonadota bacterium]
MTAKANPPETPAAPPPAGPSPPAPGDGPAQGKAPAPEPRRREIGGRKGPDPTRYGDWEYKGRCIDF